jgi:DNA-binding NarL/FixJ family response regulator
MEAIRALAQDRAAERVAVTVVADDQLSRAGVLSQLRDEPGIRVLERPSGEGPTVAIVVSEAVDEPTSALLRGLRRDGQRRVVLVVARLDDAAVLAAAEHGVSGILRRSEATTETLVGTVRTVAAGDGALPSDMLGRLMEQVGRLQHRVLAPRGLTFSGLSEREVSVLRLLAEGMDTAEVGARLYYSERTVKNIVHDVTSRFELRNRTHAVAFAIREGYI